MKYNVGKSFIKLLEYSGTVHNDSDEYTLEMSTTPAEGSGILLYPKSARSFRYHDMYLRCLDGSTVVKVVPFDLNLEGIGDEGTVVTDGNFLHLTFDFPTGSNKTMLLHNPRPNLTQADIEDFSEYVIENDIFRNDFAEPTTGIKKALIIKSFIREKKPGELVGTVDTRRRLIRHEEADIDLRRTLTSHEISADIDLRRRVKWRWLTQILPESSFLDPKMYAAADALDDQITLFHWAIKNVLHLPRLDELNGTILDLLAEQFHVDYYDSINFTDEEKRELIRESIAWHRIKGTPAAVEKVLSFFFKTYKIDEWFDYGGEPYYFRIAIKGNAFTKARFQSFWRMLTDAKNVRSHLDKITQDLSTDIPVVVAHGAAQLTCGKKIIGMKCKLPTQTGRIYYGAASAICGRKIIGMKHKLPVTIGCMHHGAAAALTGKKIIGMKTN